MSDLEFSIVSAEPKMHAASPTIRFVLHIRHGELAMAMDGASFARAQDVLEPTGPPPSSVEAIVLRVQIRLEPQWRTYTDAEKPLLEDLFGTPDRWGTTLRALSWADVPVMVPAFTGQTQADVNVPCTYDFDFAAARYFSALEDGDIPLRFFFSGSIFRTGESGFSAERVSWSSECAYRMPYTVWRDAMRACYGEAVVLRIDRETFEHLQRVRAETGARSWDEVILSRHGELVEPPPSLVEGSP
jgi:hypothetical protein